MRQNVRYSITDSIVIIEPGPPTHRFGSTTETGLSGQAPETSGPGAHSVAPSRPRAMRIGTGPVTGRRYDYQTHPLFPGGGPSFCCLHGAAPGIGPEAFADAGIDCPASVARSVPARQADFLRGRLCARVAVRRVRPGFAGDIPIGPDREPVFPAGLSGSITHTSGFVAAVCQDARAGTVGLDAERILSPDQADRIGPAFAAPSEIDCPGWGKTPRALRHTLVFSAKESAFKALFPRTRATLPFAAGRVTGVDLYHHALTLALALDQGRGSGLPRALEIRFRVDPGLVVTFAVVRPPL